MWKSILPIIFASISLFILANLAVLKDSPNTGVVKTATTTSTSEIVATTTQSTRSTTTITKITKTTATTTQKTKPVAKTIPKTTTKEVPPAPKVTATPSEPAPNFEAINTYARGAIVNILCTIKGQELSPISGTGVVVSKDGLILTNAHIGQYFLLKDFNQPNYITCVARTGSPAYPKYNLELVYISPTWVEKNKGLIKERNPLGTGENDFAFLRITSTIDGNKLPENFSFLSMNVRENIVTGEPVVLEAYPAGFLGGVSVLQDLSLTSAITLTGTLYTFKDGSIDLISVPGTVVSQKGSSGGAVVDKYATLLGIISTTSSGDKTSERDLQAITLAYINRSLKAELGINLAQFAGQDIAVFAKKFQETNAPGLTSLIVGEINK